MSCNGSYFTITLVVLAACGFTGSSACAGVVVDMRVSCVDGVRLNPPVKYVPVTHVGQTLQIDIWATVTGSDTSPRNDGLNALIGNIQSYRVEEQPGAVMGQFSPNGTDSYDGRLNLYVTVGISAFAAPPANGSTGPSHAAVGNLGPTALYPWAVDDGSPDLGIGPGDRAAGRVVISNAGASVKKAGSNYGVSPYEKRAPIWWSEFAPTGDPIWVRNGLSNAGWSDIVGSVIFTVEEIRPGLTYMNWFPWENKGETYFQAAFWASDTSNANYTRDASQGSMTMGEPVVLVVPEPAGFGLLGVWAAILLGRRRGRR
jgi:hypothetical protein